MDSHSKSHPVSCSSICITAKRSPCNTPFTSIQMQSSSPPFLHLSHIERHPSTNSSFNPKSATKRSCSLTQTQLTTPVNWFISIDSSTGQLVHQLIIFQHQLVNLKPQIHLRYWVSWSPIDCCPSPINYWSWLWLPLKLSPSILNSTLVPDGYMLLNTHNSPESYHATCLTFPLSH